MIVRTASAAAFLLLGGVSLQSLAGAPAATAAPSFVPEVQSRRFESGTATVTVSIVRNPCTASSETRGGKPVYSCL